MLKIRLARTGKKNQPSFRIVVTEHTSPVKSKYIAVLGHYNPFTKKLVIKEDQATSWMAKGALPSEKVASLMVKAGLKSPVVERLALKRKTSMKKRMEKMALTKQAEKQPQAEISATPSAEEINPELAKETSPELARSESVESTQVTSEMPAEEIFSKPAKTEEVLASPKLYESETTEKAVTPEEIIPKTATEQNSESISEQSSKTAEEETSENP